MCHPYCKLGKKSANDIPYVLMISYTYRSVNSKIICVS